MNKWNFIKLLPMFVWILLRASTIAGAILAVDINGDSNSQTLWQPTTTIAEANDDQHILTSVDNLPQPYDESVWNSKAEPARRRKRPGRKRKQQQQQQRPQSLDEFNSEMQYNGWQQTLTASNEPSIDIAVSETQSFNEQNLVPLRIVQQQANEWRAISINNTVQSPMLQIESKLNVNDAVTGDKSDRPNHEPKARSERLSMAPSPSSLKRTEDTKSYRRHYPMAHRNEELKEQQQKQPNNGIGEIAVNLKSILKQSPGGLSLSEILQQQNLSLDDLLKGKQAALKALQNTAAPPADEKRVNSTRRLPSTAQMNVKQPRRSFHNGTTRFSNSHRPDSNAESAQSLDANNRQSNDEMIMARMRIASTIPTFAEELPRLVENRNAFEASQINEMLSAQRMPPFRGKTIKEVVSAIRPDLNNTNLRKRLPSLKSLQTKSNSQITSTVETKAEWKVLNSTVASVTLNNTAIESSVNGTVVNEQTTATMPNENHVINVTINDAETTLNTTENVKLSFREHLAPAGNQMLISSSTELPLSTQTIPITTNFNKVATTSEEPLLPYTIITFTPSAELSEVISLDQANDDLNQKLNKSVLEFNLIDLYDDLKSSEVASLEELFFSGDDTSLETYESDADDFLHASTLRFDKIFKKSLIKLDVAVRNPSLLTDIVQSTFVDDKTELLDLLGDRRSGARLVNVLKQRNMTVDELIEHRKRGSSQLHLAEIFYNRTKATATEPDASPPSSTPIQQHQIDDVTAFVQSIPEFHLDSVKSVNPDKIKTNRQVSSYFTSIGGDSSTSAFQEIANQNGNDAVARSHDIVGLELSGHGYNRHLVLIENAKLPIGVQSAIMASVSIVLISFTIFIGIFLVCSWQQKRQRKICYSDRFRAIQRRHPILSSRDGSPSKRNSSPPIVYCVDSSRHSSKLNTMDPNSPEVQEYLYDAMRKSF